MESTTEVMVASMLLEAAVMGDSLHKIIKEWRKRGCTIPQDDERDIVAGFGQRKTLDALKIVMLRFVMEYAKKTAKNPELFKNTGSVRKPDIE